VYVQIMLMLLLLLTYLTLTFKIILSYNSPFQTTFPETLVSFEFQKQQLYGTKSRKLT